MTERREDYRTGVPSQAEMATMDEIVARGYLATIGTIENTQLLKMYWKITDRVAISERELTEPEQHMKNRAGLEMLRRVDNSTFPALALPGSVYKTWRVICRLERPSNWEVDCGNACGVQDPYGWVPEDGCPVHDTNLDNLPNKTSDSPNCLHYWAPEPGPFGELDKDNEPMTACPLCKVKVAPRMFCECCGETWAPGE